jgi:hypothetical protein
MFAHEGQNRFRLWLHIPALVAMILLVLVRPGFCAGESGARECLAQASIVAQSIEMAGDQSAARRYLASTLATLDLNAALEMAGGVRRPSDAARALGAVAVGLAKTDPARAAQAATTASRLLQRIVEPTRRDQEQRLLLGEIAVLGRDAVSAGPDLPSEEARGIVASALARSDPRAALSLLDSWKLTGSAADGPRAVAAYALAESDPAQAISVANGITSEYLRTYALWETANSRPPAEAVMVAQQGIDPVVHGAILTAAAVRAAPEDPDLAESLVRQVLVAPESALAVVAASLAPTRPQRALALARSLSPQPRRWALSQIAIALAGAEPDLVEGLLKESGAGPEVVRLMMARMAAAQPTQAAQVALSMPAGEDRDAALAETAAALAWSNARQAGDLVWAIRTPAEQGRAVQRVAEAVAATDTDAATSLIGLVTDTDAALRLRARIAVVVAPRDPSAASRLLATLPESDYRVQAALDAAAAALRASRSPEEALMIATVGLDRDVALRWLLPTLAMVQASSPVNTSELMGNSYIRTLGLTDAARSIQRLEPKATPSPARAQMIRVIAEWEGM